MCLISKPDAKISTTRKPKSVYKMLDVYDGCRYATPYQCVHVGFNQDNVATLVSPMTFETEPHSKRLCVTRGIHAFTSSVKANNTAHHFIYTQVFRAVIPAGETYVLGDDQDIVATKMIIFKTEKDYFKYMEQFKK